MKKFLVGALLALVIVYVAGNYSLGIAGTSRFLDKMQTLTIQGDAEALCNLLADDVVVNIVDHTAEVDNRLGNGKVNGGKTELCTYFQTNVRPMPVSRASLQTQRNNLEVTRRHWTHPWTAEISYDEKQTLGLETGGRTLSVKTESNNKLQLVMTLSGTKIKRLESEAWLQ